MHQALHVLETGAADAMKLSNIEVPAPEAGQIQIRHSALGLNFIDIYFRTGLYKAPTSPFIPGHEAAGVVEAIGEGVNDFKVGDRVVYTHALGGYSTLRNLPASSAVKIPDNVSFDVAAASLLKGLTAHYLCRRTFELKKGDWCVVHAAAGGVGQLLTQWAKHLGANVIAVVGSEVKITLAKNAGADHVLLLRDGWEVDAKKLADGVGAHVVYDSIGKDTFPSSLDALRPRGMWVTYGNASGAIPPFEPLILSQKGSLFMTRPTLAHYLETREALENASGELFELISNGTLKVDIGQSYNGLQEITRAHEDMENRKTIGCSVVRM